ncbi:MAG: polysaccharide deacetylase family protein [Clostridia bacterium]|nr:polysaccharide deacetylase family protein [Clostridia bacterium]
MKHIFRIGRLCVVLALAAVLCFLQTAAADGDAMGWFFKKAEDHARPTLDGALSFVTEYEAYWLDTRAPDDDPVLYLTFDAGYENGNVAKVLDTLARHDAPAAFFVLEHLVRAEPELVRRMADEGHLVCNHSASHCDMTAISAEEFTAELRGLEEICREAAGVECAPYFRPPEGRFDRRVLERAAEAGYKTVFWSFAYPDWDNAHQPDPQKAEATILSHTHNGMVLLLHPTSATNAEILDGLLCAWEEMGYRFGSLDELTREEQNTESEQAWSVMTDENVYRCHENDCMKIALTFDDGPDARYTADILDYLREEQIRATFFVVGSQARINPELLLREEAEGHEIGNHTDSHPRLSGAQFSVCSRCGSPLGNGSVCPAASGGVDGCVCTALISEISACADTVYELSERQTTLFRPPEGYCTEEISALAAAMDYRVILWNIDTRDWANATADGIAEGILSQVKAGDIILFHDSVSRRDAQSLAALIKIVPVLKERGFRFVTVSELIDTGTPPSADG